MGVLNWSLTAARNALVDPLIRAFDGASARDYPDMIRGTMAGVRALSDDRGGALVSSGGGNGYVVGTFSGVTEMRPGISLSFWADRANTDEPFLNVDGTGPLRWRDVDGLALPAGRVQPGLLYTVVLCGALPGSPVEWRTIAGGIPAGRISRHLVVDQDYAAKPTDSYIAVTSLASSRTITLPAAGSFAPGQALYVSDETGLCGANLLITISASGLDTVAGLPSVTMGSPFQKLVFHSNGSNLWTV